MTKTRRRVGPFRRWTAEENEDLRRSGRKETPAVIAARLGRSAWAVKAHMNVLGVAGYRTWLPEEDAAVLSVKDGKKTIRMVADELGRSWDAVAHRCKKFGIVLKRRTPWSEAELAKLREEAGRFDLRSLSARLGRSMDGVERKLQALDLKAAPSPWKPRRVPVRKQSVQKQKQSTAISLLVKCEGCGLWVVNTIGGWGGHKQRTGCNGKARAA